MNKKIKIEIATGIIILIAIIIGSSVWLIGKKIQKTEQGFTIATTEKNSNLNEEFSGWQTYRNEEYGYEIKYPNNWKLQESIYNFSLAIYFNYGCTEPVGCACSLGIDTHIGAFAGSDMEKPYSSGKAGETEIIIGGNVALIEPEEIYEGGSTKNSITDINVINSGDYYNIKNNINLGSDKKDYCNKIFESMIKSLKFIDYISAPSKKDLCLQDSFYRSKDKCDCPFNWLGLGYSERKYFPRFLYKCVKYDTSDWLVYRNDKYNFEIKYKKDDNLKITSAEAISLGPVDINVAAYEAFNKEDTSGPGPRGSTYLGELEISPNVFASVFKYSDHGESGIKYYIKSGDKGIAIASKAVSNGGSYEEESILEILSTFQLEPSATYQPSENPQKIPYTSQIEKALKDGLAIQIINNPNLTLPGDINGGQIKKYFKLGDVFLALVLRNSINVVLDLPKGFIPAFAGILAAGQNDTQWKKLVEIKDTKTTDKNNPYYLAVKNKKLMLTIVDQNGAGSGEGIMKVFSYSNDNSWQLERCYYFGRDYGDIENDRDYFAYSTKFSEQQAESIESCQNVELKPLP